jgi:MoaA/NifB/PqqE/SkfB family radical SAM enzyme
MNFVCLKDILWATLQYKLFRKRSPVVLSISITSMCNLRCSYCYSYEDNLNAKTLSAETIRRIIDEAYALGTRVVMLQGGEPLLHPDIDAIIRYIIAKKMYCAVTTNGLLVKQHIAALTLVDQVQISVDGGRAITDKHRGAGVFDAVVRALQLCHSERIPFHMHAVITNDSTEENTIWPLMTLAQEYHTYINFCIPNPPRSAEEARSAGQQQIQDFYRLLYDKKKQGMPTNTSWQAIESMIKWGDRLPYDVYVAREDHAAIKRYKYERCVMGNLVAWLDARGFLHPCAVHFGQEGFSTSIHDRGLAGAWERLQQVPCQVCPNSAEFNSLFNLRFEALLNAVKFMFKRK